MTTKYTDIEKIAYFLTLFFQTTSPTFTLDYWVPFGKEFLQSLLGRAKGFNFFYVPDGSLAVLKPSLDFVYHLHRDGSIGIFSAVPFCSNSCF